MTKLAGNLPTGDKNGLHPITVVLLNDPTNAHLALVMISTKSITTDTDTASREATIRIDRIEVVTDPEDVTALELMFRRVMEDRLGDTIPFADLKDDLDEEFSRISITVAPHSDDDFDEDAIVDAEVIDDELGFDDSDGGNI